MCSDSDSQLFRLKRDQLCPVLLAFCRLMLSTQESARISLVRPIESVGGQTSLETEALAAYIDILNRVGEHLCQETTLEQDEELLRVTPSEKWQLKMALLYRVERKKIWKSQCEIASKAMRVLQGKEKVLDDTPEEAKTRIEAANDEVSLQVFEKEWLYRRLVNAWYYKGISKSHRTQDQV